MALSIEEMRKRSLQKARAQDEQKAQITARVVSNTKEGRYKAEKQQPQAPAYPKETIQAVSQAARKPFSVNQLTDIFQSGTMKRPALDVERPKVETPQNATTDYDKLLKEKYAQLENTAPSNNLNDPTRYNLMQEIRQLEQEKKDAEQAGKVSAVDWLGSKAGQLNSGMTKFLDVAANAIPIVEGALFGVDKEGTLTGQLLKPLTTATGKLHEWTSGTTDALNQKVDAAIGDNKALKIASDVGGGIITALPNAALALMSGGTSVPAQLGAQGTGLAATTATALNKLVSNPMFKLSAAQSLGNSFEEAKAAGATDEEALAAAVLTAGANAAVEVGGGIETLPGQLKGADLTSGAKAWNWVKSALDEGKEEVVQGAIQKFVEKGVYDNDKALFSTTDENAVFNPGRMAKEFGLGTAVGGILGGGQLVGDMFLNRGKANGPAAAVMQDVLGEKKTAPVIETEAESTSVNTDPAKHTPQEQAVIEDYQSSVDDGLVQFAQGVANGSVAPKAKYQLKPVSDRAATDILHISGVDTHGFSTVIEGRMVDHITKRHGASGTADHSMQDLNDLGRIQYVIDNYDNISDGGTSKAYTTNKANGKPGNAKTVVFEKAVNGTYYVVEAVPDTKAKTTFVVSAYMSKNGQKKTGAEQLTDVSKDTPVFTPESGFAQTPESNIRANTENVNGSVGAAESGFDPLSHASNTYGAIEPGEMPARTVDVPKAMDDFTRVSHFARTGAEATVGGDEMADHILKMVAENKLSHEIFTDDAALEQAGEKIAKAYREGRGYSVYTDFLKDVAAGKAGKDLMATGTLLYADAVSNGDYESGAELFLALTEMQTRSGQTVQSARLLKKLSPEGRVWMVNKTIGKIEAEINAGRKQGDTIHLKVDDSLVDAFKNAETPKAQAEAMDNIYKAVAEQMPTTLGDALQQLRYFAMLANVSTHLKNISGNAGQTVLVAMKDAVAAAAEEVTDAVSKAMTGKGIQRTKAFLNPASQADRALFGTAWEDFGNVEADVAGIGKYQDSARYQVAQHQNYWKINDPKSNAAKVADKVLRTAEKAPQANSKLMNIEDRWFSRPHYAAALAGYMKANHMTEPNEQARDYAIKEAQKATFRDLNAVSKFAKGLGKHKGTKILADTVFPFKATPANVGVRAVEYSPAGIATTLYKAWKSAKAGEFQASELIDDLAKSLTGSALGHLGYVLAKNGILRVAGIGDEKEKEQQKLEGKKDNSLFNVPVEFISPAAATLLLGGAIYESAATKDMDGQGYGITDRLTALSGIADPIFETTMLTGFDDILSAIRSSGNDVGGTTLLTNMGIRLLGNYLGSYLSSQLSRIHASGDEYARQTYVDKNKNDSLFDLPEVQRAVQGLQYKTAGRENMTKNIDAWGRPVEGGKVTKHDEAWKNMLGSVFNAVTPTYPGSDKTTAVDEELKRLYRAKGVDTSDLTLFMTDAPKSFFVDGKNVQLTGDQWEQYQTERGQGAFSLLENLLNSEAYQALPDNIRAAAMDKALKLANARAKSGLDVGYTIKTDWMAELDGADAEAVTNALIAKAAEDQLGTGAERFTDLGELTSAGTISDAVAVSMLSQELQTGYFENIQGSGISMDKYLDVVAYKAGDGIKQPEVKSYIEKNFSGADRIRVWKCFYSENTIPDEW